MVWWILGSVASSFGKPIAYAAIAYVATMMFLPELNAEINQLVVDLVWNNFKNLFIEKAKEEIV